MSIGMYVNRKNHLPIYLPTCVLFVSSVHGFVSRIRSLRLCDEKKNIATNYSYANEQKAIIILFVNPKKKNPDITEHSSNHPRMEILLLFPNPMANVTKHVLFHQINQSTDQSTNSYFTRSTNPSRSSRHLRCSSCCYYPQQLSPLPRPATACGRCSASKEQPWLLGLVPIHSERQQQW